MRFFWCAAILAAGVVHGQDAQRGQGPNFIDKDKETAIGQQLAKAVRSHTTALDSAIVSEYVGRIGARLAAQPQFSAWNFQFETVRDGAGKEPIALPGGIIFISSGLIGAARNEAELAGLLAHAMAHVADRDWSRKFTHTTLVEISMQAGLPPPAGDLTDLPAQMQFADFTHLVEKQADALAVGAMAAAGYDPAGLASFLQRIPANVLPDRDDRVAAVRAEIGKLPARSYAAEGGDFARVQTEVRK